MLMSLSSGPFEVAAHLEWRVQLWVPRRRLTKKYLSTGNLRYDLGTSQICALVRHNKKLEIGRRALTLMT